MKNSKTPAGLDDPGNGDYLAGPVNNPSNWWQLVVLVLTHPQTALVAFAAGALYLAYLTTIQHEALMTNEAQVIKNQAQIVGLMSDLDKNDQALVRLEDRQINLMIQLLPNGVHK